MGNCWFTSDLHLGHSPMIMLCDRPFENVYKMDRGLIRNWNARVKPEDTVFHLGDFCFRNRLSARTYLKELNGKIILIRGNHDHNNGTDTPILDMNIHYGGENLLLIHDPADVTCFGGKLVLCGHVHTSWKFQRRYYDFNTEMILSEKDNYTDFCNVGVDAWNYYPITINEILKEYNNWKITQV